MTDLIARILPSYVNGVGRAVRVTLDNRYARATRTWQPGVDGIVKRRAGHRCAGAPQRSGIAIDLRL